MVKTIIIVAEKTPVAVGNSNFYVKKKYYSTEVKTVMKKINRIVYILVCFIYEDKKFYDLPVGNVNYYLQLGKCDFSRRKVCPQSAFAIIYIVRFYHNTRLLWCLVVSYYFLMSI
jgi:hypothetical protein